VSTLAALGAGLVLAFLLGIATSNPALYERHYVWLFWVNVALASTLVLVIVVAGVRMLWRVSRGRFGSRLLLKLAAIFALVGILPGVLIYTVSYQFVSRSIESWFDIKVGEQERFLVVTQALAPGLAANALAVTSAYREYQQRALARTGLRKMYIGTLTLALVLAVFGALLLAIALSNQLAQPLLLLAEGV